MNHVTPETLRAILRRRQTVEAGHRPGYCILVGFALALALHYLLFGPWPI
jgi:hypothetical protein